MHIGWIGTGVMGLPMCRHIMNKICSKHSENRMSVFNRNKAKAKELVEIGAAFERPEEMANKCDVIFMMVGGPEDVRSLAFDPENGVLARMRPGTFLIDHTTSSAGLATEIASAASNRGIVSIDAPVSGGDIGAIEGNLVVMAGGCSEAHLRTVRPLIECYSQAITLFGEEPGTGQHAKLSNQIMIANTMEGLCEGLLYAYKVGLNLDSLIELLKDGAAGSFSMRSYGPRMVQRNFKAGCYVRHFVKDLGIAVEEAKNMKLVLPGLHLAEQMYLALQENGGAELGTHSLILCLEKINNLKLSCKKPLSS